MPRGAAGPGNDPSGAPVAPGAPGDDDEGDEALEEKIRQMLKDLGRALSGAIAESSDVNLALRRIHEEGYSLFIFLERRDRDEEAEAGDHTEAARPALPRGQPVFRINGGDLSFLRSIGIDPTRRVRGRKGGGR